ncbi:hypothetical protein N7492_000520 [Penicillium capsulatum]|uniref:RNase H type-1 domain-containing protein n=1 Tax=Penicillium capsulatum TaxID=69766 RepID=A0A9W9LZH2_9EURO|nr:hypothetical protein N7492_000520 [Penicillium capsulatum]KAJ6130421.1 hypothetical protein N7512_003201 [Penicillium capsulatum]
MASGQLGQGPNGHTLVLPTPFAPIPLNPEDDDTNDDEKSDDELSILHLPHWIYARSDLGTGPKDLRVRGGRVIPQRFVVADQDAPPESLFRIGIRFNPTPPVRRFLNLEDSRQVLVFAYGACLDSGTRKARAGCAIVYRDSTISPQVSGYARFRMEKEGPTGEKHPPTGDRADLRAAIAALRFRCWVEEGFASLVLAIPSDYVVDGITNKVRTWKVNGWKTNTRAPVRNRDLWLCLLGEIERWHEQDLEVYFWRIKREWNLHADRKARKAADDTPRDKYMDICGLFV